MFSWQLGKIGKRKLWYGVEVKVNKEGIYFDYDEIAVEIDRSNPQEFELTLIDEATNKPIYQDVRNTEWSLENIR